MTTKRGQGLPLNTIIIAILVVTVLVVLIVIFTGGIGRFTGGLADCSAQSGDCIRGEYCPKGYSKAVLAECGENEVCCIKAGEKKCEELGGECYSAGTPAHNLVGNVWRCDSAAGYEKIPYATCQNSDAGYTVECCKK